jgi:hypothetical protein
MDAGTGRVDESKDDETLRRKFNSLSPSRRRELWQKHVAPHFRRAKRVLRW